MIDDLIINNIKNYLSWFDKESERFNLKEIKFLDKNHNVNL